VLKIQTIIMFVLRYVRHGTTLLRIAAIQHSNCVTASKTNNYNYIKGQSNFAKGDITRSISPIIFVSWQQASRSWSLDAYETQFGGRRGRMRSAMVPFERSMVVFPALHCDSCAICKHSSAICHRMSALQRSNQQGWVTFGQSLGRKGLTDISHILTRCGRHGAVVCKRNCVDIFCRLSTMHECDRQTDRQTDRPRNGNDTTRQNRYSAMSPNNKERQQVYNLSRRLLLISVYVMRVITANDVTVPWSVYWLARMHSCL